LIGLGYFMLAPLTILVANGGYRIPEFYQANERYASVNLSDVRYLVPMLVISLSLLFAFQSLTLLRRQHSSFFCPSRLTLNDHKLKTVIYLTLAFSIIDLVFAIWRSGGVVPFLISHWYLRQEEAVAKFGDVFVLYTRLSLANQVVFTAAAALFSARRLQLQKSQWRFAILIIVGLLLQMVTSGNRIFIALYGLSFLTAVCVYRRHRLIVMLLILSPAVLLFFSAWAYFRNNLNTALEDLPKYVERDLGNRTVTTLMDTTEGTNILLLLHMINDFGSKHDYYYGSTYSKAITFMLPRSVYANKPENFPALIARHYEPGEVTSLGATQLGELYANFGPLAVLLLPAVTVLTSLFSDMLARTYDRHALLSAVLFLLAIWYARSSFEDNVITLLFSLFLIRSLRLERGLVG
jgi:oligosaccharide repeat unit polymerase